MSDRPIEVHTKSGKFQQIVDIGPHHFVADEPVAAGGEDAGPNPFELVTAGLGVCTSMTVKLYTDRKGWKLEHIDVSVTHRKEGDVHYFHREIKLTGALSDDERGRCLEIAEKCPVHKMLTGEIRIETVLVGT